MSPKFLMELSKSILNIYKYSKRINELIVKTELSDNAVEEIKKEVADWELEQNFKGQFDKIGKTQLELLSLSSEPKWSEALNNEPFFYAASLAKDHETDVLKALEALKEFRKNVQKLKVELELGEISYEPSKLSKVEIEISHIDAQKAKAIGSSRQTGKYTFVFEPYNPVKLSLGGALVYSFVKRNKYKTIKDGEKFKIAQEEAGGEAIGQNIAAMLNIAPQSWNTPNFGLSFQFGLNPKKDETAFFLGAGMKLQQLVTFGGGFTFQQVPKLSTGLQVGALIDSPDALKTTPKYESGFYLHITVNSK